MENEIEKKQNSELATTARRGHEEPVDQSDLMIPRSLIIQFTPPRSPMYDPAKHQPGMIVNSITMEQLPKDTNGRIVFIPIKRFANWVRFNPVQKDKPNFDPKFEPGAVIWRSDDPSDPKVIKEGAWGDNNEPPLATKFINYVCVIPGMTMPIVISFGKTSFKAGKTLSTMTQFAPGDLFSWKYGIKARLEKNEVGQYFVLAVEQIGKCDEAEFKMAEEYFTKFAGAKVKMHEDPIEETEEGQPETKTTEKPWN